MSAVIPEINPSVSLGNAELASGGKRVAFIRWLRKIHGWIGLWGALLGLLFGFTGIVMNHRAVLKIPAMQSQETNLQLPLPVPTPGSADDLARWVQSQVAPDLRVIKVKEDKARPVAWGDKSLTQPAHWMMSFTSPRANIQADWWVGNQYVSVKRSDNNIFTTLANLHKGVGMSVGWILLVDTIGGSILLLSITGVILWTQLNRRRVLGAAIATTSVALTIGLILNALS